MRRGSASERERHLVLGSGWRERTGQAHKDHLLVLDAVVQVQRSRRPRRSVHLARGWRHMRAVVRCMLQQAEGRECASDRTSTLGNLSPTAMPRACVRSICAERDRPRELRASMLSRAQYEWCDEFCDFSLPCYLLSAEEALADLPAPFGTAARSYGQWRPPRWPSWPGRVGCMSRLAVGVIVGSLCLV